MIGLFVPGDGPVYRVGAGVKLLVLFATLTGAAWVASPWWIGSVGTALLVAAVAAGTPWRPLARQLTGTAPWALGFVVLQWFAGSPASAVRVGLMLELGVGLAAAVTLTTRLEAVCDVVERALGPLRRWGVDPQRPAFMLALLMRSVAVVLDLHRRTTEALRARDARRTPAVVMVPLVVQTVRYADRLAEALVARGYGEDAGPGPAADAARTGR